MELNKEHIALWIADLRSGNYPQGRGKLATRNGGFCCMGVACETGINNGLDLIKVDAGNSGDETARFNYGVDEDRSYMPVEVAEWLGFDSVQSNDPIIIIPEMNDFDGPNPTDVIYNRSISLSQLNDSWQFNFGQIADLAKWAWINGGND